MKSHFFKFLLIPIFGAISAASAAPVGPNILIIYTDDQGSVDANCYGSKDFRTLMISSNVLPVGSGKLTNSRAPAIAGILDSTDRFRTDDFEETSTNNASA